MCSAAGAHVLARDVVVVRGTDAASYLQGQCSQDVESLAAGASAEALLLSPRGKIDAYVRVTRLAEQEFVLDGDGGTGPAVVARLERFRLRVDVDIALLPWACVAVRGPSAARAVAAGPALVVPVAWPGLAGVDLLGPTPEAGEASWLAEEVVGCGDDAWEALRIEAGIPVSGREITDETIPAEVGLIERTVSFTKGCFTGQELVARLDARGTKVARRLAGLVLTASSRDDLPPCGATVGGEGGPDSGQLTSVAWSPGLDAAVGLSVLHRRINPPAAVEVRWEDGAEHRAARAEARPLPLRD